MRLSPKRKVRLQVSRVHPWKNGGQRRACVVRSDRTCAAWIGGMGARLRVQEVAVRCGGGVYGAATRHAALAAAVGWRCRARRGWRLIQNPPNPTDLLHFSPPVLRPSSSRTQTLFSLLSPCHLICICFSSPLLLVVPSRVPKDLIFLSFSRKPASEGEDWWREEGDQDLLTVLRGRDGGAGAGAAGEDERDELAPHQ